MSAANWFRNCWERPDSSADDAGWSLPRAIASVSATPAAMIGLTDRGEIALEKRADLIRVARAAPEVGAAPVVTQVWRAGERIA